MNCDDDEPPSPISTYLPISPGSSPFINLIPKKEDDNVIVMHEIKVHIRKVLQAGNL